jgi:hypothetical protein
LCLNSLTASAHACNPLRSIIIALHLLQSFPTLAVGTFSTTHTQHKYKIQSCIILLGLLWQPQTPPTAAKAEGFEITS